MNLAISANSAQFYETLFLLKLEALSFCGIFHFQRQLSEHNELMREKLQ